MIPFLYSSISLSGSFNGFVLSYSSHNSHDRCSFIKYFSSEQSILSASNIPKRSPRMVKGFILLRALSGQRISISKRHRGLPFCVTRLVRRGWSIVYPHFELVNG